jgi:exodeoxyribonuclease V alpha subunit
LNDGHCGLPKDLLLKKAEELLNIPQDILLPALEEELTTHFLVQDSIESDIVIFLRSYYVFEKMSAAKLKSLNGVTKYNIDHVKAIEWVERLLSMKFAEQQKLALETMIKSKLCIISDCPGTGKTTIMKAFIKILMTKHYKIHLCAPTGRAAKRLFETTGIEAFTIHRLLKFDPIKGKFQYNENNLLKTDVLIIDESSMLDVQLLYNLLKSIPEHASVILVGDVDQLPSVGAGQVLKNIIDSNSIITIRLNKIFRQGEDSQIITNAHLVNKGMFPKLESSRDFVYIETQTPEETTECLLKIMKNVTFIAEVQVLCPMQRGSCGARSLNIELQKLLNKNQGIERYGQLFAVSDRVMQLENNYDKDVYNGDMGFITAIDHEEHKIQIDFDGRIIPYSFDELDELTISYAITIHKSQGSEYSVVIITLTTQSFMMLQKNLLYTAITRGKKKVILIGQKRAIAIAVKNNKENHRFTKLKE